MVYSHRQKKQAFSGAGRHSPSSRWNDRREGDKARRGVYGQVMKQRPGHEINAYSQSVITFHYRPKWNIDGAKDKWIDCQLRTKKQSGDRIEKAIRKLKSPPVNSKLPYGQEGRKKPGASIESLFDVSMAGDE